jgi:hypothetical protein
VREWIGVWLKDRWCYERAFRSQQLRYLQLTNRQERLSPAPDGSGFACCWSYTSRLHAPMIQPRLGQRLLQRCLSDAPIECSNEAPPTSEHPQVTVLIGHRGFERLPLLLATLESFAAQRDVIFECIVIEQDTEPKIKPHLPGWVGHIHCPTDDSVSPYNRSRAFNMGARHANAPILLLHDNDMLVPCNYLFRILEKLKLGYHVVNSKRFIFYLSQSHSAMILSGKAFYDSLPAECIVQNLEAGGSMAILRSAYWCIGGMDESFVGWGGEDNEFWDRCQTLNCWIWGYEPIVHLWHSSQPLKHTSNNPNLVRANERLHLSRQVRIDQLKAANLR